MDIHDLRARLRSILDEMEALDQAAESEDRDLTDEEQSDYDGLRAESESLQRRIRRLQDMREQRDAAAGVDPQAEPERESRGRRVITDVHDYDAGDFRNFGEFIYAVRFQPGDQRLRGLAAESREQPAAEAQVMGSGVNDDTGGPLGGFAVPEQFRATLLEVPQQSAIIRPRATVIPAGTPPDAPINIPALDQGADSNRYGGVEVSWIEEGDDKPQTNWNLAKVTLEPHEVAGHIVLSDKLLRNWPAADALTRRLLGAAVVGASETAFMSGSGNGQPQGIINSAAAATVARGTANQISYADVAAMYAAFQMGGSPVWIASQSVLPQLLTMRNLVSDSGSGDFVFQPGVREGVMPQLFGFPIVWSERSPALGSEGDLVLADLSYYLIKDGSGPFVAASEHVRFISNETVIKIFWYVDGTPWLTGPVTLENGYEVSPFVVLDVPAAGDGDGA